MLLSVHRRTDELAGWVREFAPHAVCVTDPGSARNLSDPGVRVYAGSAGLGDAIGDIEFDLLVNGIVGAAGLQPSFDALRAGRDVATANKESLVIAGELLTRTAAASGAHIRPIDSEHSAIWQCLRAGGRDEVERVWLTGSGGPFRRRPAETFDDITVEEALGHPTWKMGAKITIDSATLMNKGFEIIEARWLFDLRPDQIEVVIQPQSIVHSAVTFRDGSTVAQMGVPDMRHPIQYAIFYPERVGPAPAALDLAALGSLDFEPPDRKRFPALSLAETALERGGASPVALNAANEVAVHAFLEGRIRYPRITECVAVQMDTVGTEQLTGMDDIYEVDRCIRTRAADWLENVAGTVTSIG